MNSSNLNISSANTGTASSAAAVGVGARRSDTKSVSVVSVSCPTDDIIGVLALNIARTTFSSLNENKSSNDPPPRPIIIVSMSSLLSAFSMFSTIESADFSP